MPSAAAAKHAIRNAPRQKKGAFTALELIYERTCERMVKLLDPDMRRSVIGRQRDAAGAALSAREIELVRSTCEHTVQEEEIRVEHGMGLLATIVTASPMLGLLDGYRAAVHWRWQDDFAERFPKVIATSHLFDWDRDRLTACGGMAGKR